jgi:hypothetical protein
LSSQGHYPGCRRYTPRPDTHRLPIFMSANIVITMNLQTL